LAGILVLALGLPFTAVRTLHAHRLQSADRDLQTLAQSLRDVTIVTAAHIPPGTQILSGSGNRPIVIDDRWNTASAYPLSRTVGSASAGAPQVDPWGNTYLVMMDAAAAQPAWVVSAGPDGILQTPLDRNIATPSGDDRALRIAAAGSGPTLNR